MHEDGGGEETAIVAGEQPKAGSERDVAASQSGGRKKAWLPSSPQLCEEGKARARLLSPTCYKPFVCTWKMYTTTQLEATRTPNRIPSIDGIRTITIDHKKPEKNPSHGTAKGTASFPS